jgi:tRNA(fMet)-specific endonuclease VapC
MTGNNLFLDTNIIIEVFSGNKIIAEKVYNLSPFYTSAIVLGELYIGINRVVNKKKHLQQLTGFLELCTVLDVNQITSQFFGEITASLYKKGKPIPTNDIWIAATTKQYDLTLISRDKHFSEIDGIVLESW